jgi:hypothetical protein
VRVQPDRYAAFRPGVPSSALKAAAVRWILLGALASCVGLALSFTSRSRLVAAGWPLVVAAFLAVLLAKWFPERTLAISRIELLRTSADNRARVTQEYAYVEAFNEPAEIAIRGLVTPLYADTAELRNAQAELALGDSRPRLQTVVYPNQPALFAAADTSPCVLADFPKLFTIRARAGGQTLAFPCDDPRRYAARRAAVWVKADGAMWLLRNIAADGAFDLGKFDSWAAAVRASGGADEDLNRARAVALSWASREALRARRETIIVWDELPGERSGLVALEAPAPSLGSTFQIAAVQTVPREDARP